jgi:DNA repair photolyase
LAALFALDEWRIKGEYTAMAQALIGIARMAAESLLLEAKQRVEYRELGARSYLTRCSNASMPFAWTINPYRGCEFGCVYCYARYTHEFMELRNPADFENRIFAKSWDAARFRAELRKLKFGEGVAIGTATDPYQPAERRYGLTRKMLEMLAGERGLRVFVTTKSDLVARDAGLLLRVARQNEVRVGITITTIDAALARKLEPYAPRPDLRLGAVRALAKAGVTVGVQCMPVMPLINDSERQLNQLALAAAAHGASSFAGQVLFLKPCAQQVFFPFLERTFPHLAKRYRQRFEKNARLKGAYPDVIRERIRAARRLAGLSERDHLPPIAPPQLSFEF